MKKVNLIKCSSELYEFIDRVSIEIHEIHTDLNHATHGFHSYLLQCTRFLLLLIVVNQMIFGIVFTNGCKFSIKKCFQKGLKKCDYSIYIWI